MATVKPFHAIRPEQSKASRVAALPYDVYNREEAYAEAKKEPLSFLNIDRPETQFDPSMDMYSQEVYDKAAQMLKDEISEGVYVKDDKACYYIYELTMDGRTQTGLVACASIDDYLNNVIMKHENTRAEKEKDRIRHVDTCNAQTGPIFLAYRANEAINQVIEKVKEGKAVYDFTSEDGISHRVWMIADETQMETVCNAFKTIDNIYIADGHHRAASAVKVGGMRRESHPDYNGTEEFNYFLSVLFADEQLMIMPYNRVVKDLAGLSKENFLAEISKEFEVEEVGEMPVDPDKKGTFGMYLEDTWYKLCAKEEILSKDPVDGLDVAILQNHLLEPVLKIADPKTDNRIDFVGGIRGLKELEKRCHEDMYVAFSMYPTSIGELFAVSDAGRLMPPKSTWFEPKLRSGLFIHSLED